MAQKYPRISKWQHSLLIVSSFTSKNSKNISFVVQFWNQWIFLSQNYRFYSSCTFWLALKRTKQFFDDFVSKMALKNASFVWKMGFGWFVFSTTVTETKYNFRTFGVNESFWAKQQSCITLKVSLRKWCPFFVFVCFNGCHFT